MSSAQAHMTRPVPQSRSRLWQAVAAISLLSVSCAWAQTASDAKFQAAHSEWRRLSQTEVNCVDQSLRAERSNLWSLIQQGIHPSDAKVAKLRAACRTPAKAPEYSVAAVRGSQALAAAVESVTDKAAADKAAADKAAADKAAPDKIATEKAAAAKAAADKAAADKAAADKAAADKVAADKAAAGKLAADRIAADRAAAEKAAADKAAADKAAAGKLAADKAAADLAKADAERAKTDALKAQADAEQRRKEVEVTTTDAALAYSAAELRTSFIYGLVSGPTLFVLGGVVFLLMHRRKTITGAQAEAGAPHNAGNETQGEFDRLVTAVLAEQKRRDRKPAEPIAPEREQRIDEVPLH
jgi:hypothetical protein